MRAVGWLAAGHEFARGPTNEIVAVRVDYLVEEGWMHVVAAGPHLCELCESARSASSVLVPSVSTGLLYAAPAMITHYMRDHEYLPPQEFCEAVLICPAPDS